MTSPAVAVVSPGAVVVTKAELLAAFFDAPPRYEPGRPSQHTGLEAVAWLVARRCEKELVIEQ